MAFVAAVVQLTTTEDVARALDEAEARVAHAAALGARFVALPENVSFMGSEADKRRLAEPLEGPTFQRLSGWAKRFGVHLLGGTLPERSADPERAYNTSTLWAPDGRLLAAYRKIHLFDVALGEGATHRESASVMPGERAVLASTPLGRIGLSVCYDVRFPGLYRALAHAGAQLFTIPAAFTVPTGRDHWEVLLRARAIENLAYVVAPGQYGAHDATRRTYGRSMIIDPWGTVLATVPDGGGVALAEIDLARSTQLRASLPCLSHERPDADATIEHV